MYASGASSSGGTTESSCTVSVEVCLPPITKEPICNISVNCAGLKTTTYIQHGFCITK